MRNAIVAVTFAVALIGKAIAGGGCSERNITAEEVRSAVQIAIKTREYLDGIGPDVALVARVGSDVSKHGMRYTHVGAVVKEHPFGSWTFVHLLNECGSDRSSIYDEGLVNFYLDDLFAYDGLVVVPTPELQAKLKTILLSQDALVMHTSHYSMLARPDSALYQNSNQWLLETLAFAIAPQGAIHNRADAQKWLRSEGFEGDYVKVTGLERAGAALFRSNIRFDDHSTEETAKGTYQMVGVKSIMKFLDQKQLIALKRVISLDRLEAGPLMY